MLSARLKELEAARVVERRVLPRPSNAVVYELTDYGRELDAVLLHLANWGTRSLGDPRDGDSVSPGSLLLGLRANFRPEAARGLRATYELRLGDTVVHARVDDGAIEVGEGPAEADLTIEADLTLRAVMARELSPADALRGGSIRIEGDEALWERFPEVFAI